MRALLKSEWTNLVIALTATISTAILTLTHFNAVVTFIMSGVALAILALVVGEATEQLGNLLGPGATGVVQASIASMPELFVSFFALRAGLVTVVQSALVGSILANTLLVMGLAFLFGGWKNGTAIWIRETALNCYLNGVGSIGPGCSHTCAYNPYSC